LFEKELCFGFVWRDEEEIVDDTHQKLHDSAGEHRLVVLLRNLPHTHAVLRRGKSVSSILHVPEEVGAQQATDFGALRNTSILQVVIFAKLWSRGIMSTAEQERDIIPLTRICVVVICSKSSLMMAFLDWKICFASSMKTAFWIFCDKTFESDAKFRSCAFEEYIETLRIGSVV
jgi:hypothetical protein